MDARLAAEPPQQIERRRRRWADRQDDAKPSSAPITTEELRSRLIEPPDGDYRTRSQTDRDRVLYCSAFRRLGGVTQVASATEGRIFHNRLTHSLKVAQVGRRLAERLLTKQSGLADEWGGLDPDVVEAAALAHDLGHPPFGHIAETHLGNLCDDVGGLQDGFEGNAQAFRIVTRLAAHRQGYHGLDLTRATLNAILKYPWSRGDGRFEGDKYSVYDDDEREFEFARHGMEDGRRSLEAEIMDFADDITYSVHDFDDFCRAGLIPVDRLVHVGVSRDVVQTLLDTGTAVEEWPLFPSELDEVLGRWKADLRERRKKGEMTPESSEIDDAREDFRDLLERFHLTHGYTGSHEDRTQLRWATSQLIDTFVSSCEIASTGSKHALAIVPRQRLQLKFLQFLVNYFVINNPALATQQAAQRQVVESLWRRYFSAFGATEKSWNRDEIAWDLVPPPLIKDLAKIVEHGYRAKVARRHVARLAADAVATLTDAEAMRLYRRLTGVVTGSVRDSLPY